MLVLVLIISAGNAMKFPIGSFLAMKKFYGREIIIIIVNAFMGLPPVVVGLFLYLKIRVVLYVHMSI